MKTTNTIKTNSVKEIMNIKKKNKQLKRSIDTINIICYLLIMLLSIPYMSRILYMIQDVQSDSYYFSIASICGVVYFMMCMLVYGTIINPSLDKIRNKISMNIEKINEIKHNSSMEMEQILNKLRFMHNYDQIKDF